MEDFVSMGVTSAHKARSIVEKTQQILAIELMCAAQLLDFRLPLKPGLGVQQAQTIVRSYVTTLEEDRALSPDIEKLSQAVREGAFAHIA
jgi:histidine ammonia-lyase